MNNETLLVEAAYFKAIGIDTQIVPHMHSGEYLVNRDTKEVMRSLLRNTSQIHSLMLEHDINIEFREGFVLARPAGMDCMSWASYGDEQWQTKAWALGMVVVRAATEKLNSVRDK